MPTLSIGIVAFASMLITLLLGFWIIPILRKLKFGQTILEIGPRWHKDKQGTPTMGGILFVVGILAGVAVGISLINSSLGINKSDFDDRNNLILLAGIVMAIAFCAVGFLDDYIKVSKKENLGLTEKQKLILQLIISIGYIGILYTLGETSTILWLPFIGQWKMGLLYYPVMVLGIIFIINVVNFTDGIDGLCSSVTLVVSVGFLAISYILSYYSTQVLSAALAGGCIGFLAWNAYPAKVFMGDTGSFFLGGIVVALVFSLRIPAIIIFMGFVYAVEGITVIIQMCYFKYTRKKTGEGKRLFKMTPIHHHFEMSGWSENKIVIRFSVVQLIMCIIAVFAVSKI